MRYLSVCSGIEAATVAWAPLGWRAIAFAEIEKFPRAVLRHHYPDTRLCGDFTKLRDEPWIVDADVLVGGTPCQAFSVAGLRKSLDDDRGNLSLEFIRLADAIDDLRRDAGREPAWICWENVPGVLSTHDNAFGAFLGGLVGGESAIEPPFGRGWRGAGVVSGPERVAAWRILDAQHFGVAQRRRRVFVLALGGAGAWRCADALLPIIDSLSGHPPPRRETGERAAPTLAARTRGGGGLGTDFDCDGELIASTGDISHCLNAGGMGRQDYETETLITHTLRADGFDASEDGTGRGTPLVPTYAIQERAVSENPAAGPQGKGYQPDLAYTMEARTQQQAVAFSCKDYDAGATAPTLRAMGHEKSHANAGGQVAVAFAENSRAELRLEGGDGQRTGALNTGGGKPGQGVPMVAAPMAVRRITPVEAERLMGFPDGYTAIPWRGKPAEACPDGPRYKALGNSMAVPVMRWIGERIAMVEAIARDEARSVA